MYDAVNRSSIWAVPYFVLYYFIVVIVILNLFAALVVEALLNISASRKLGKGEEYFQDHNTFELYTKYLA